MGQPTVGSNPTPSARDGRTAPIDDEAAMAIALEEARRAGEHGDVPVGAVVLVGGEVVSRAGNRREQDGDPTAHAEVLALRAAAAALGSWRLDGATLVVTLEPCPMCAGALVGARVAPGRVRRRQHRQRRPAARSTTSASTRASTTRSRSCTACRPSRPPRCSTTSSPPAAPDRLGRARGRWLTWSTESCQSGRMGRSRKPLWVSAHRGFESHALRSRTTRRCPASRRTLGTDHVSCARQLRGRRRPSRRCGPG